MLALLTSLILAVLGNGFFLSFISLYMQHRGYTLSQIGSIQSAFYVGFLISSFGSAYAISKIGHIRVISASLGTVSGITSLMFLVNPNFWLPFRFISGLAIGAFYIAIESWILAQYPKHRRGQALAIYTIALYTAQSLSQLFLSVVEKQEGMAFAIAAGFMSLAIATISLNRNPGPPITKEISLGLMPIIKKTPLAIFGCFLSGVLLSSIPSFLPLYCQWKGFDPGILLAITVGGGSFLNWPVGKLSDTFDRRKTLGFLALIGSSLFLLTPLISNYYLFAVSMFFIGGAIYTIYPLSMAIGCDIIAAKDTVKLTEAMMLSFGAGAIIGPILTPLAEPLSPHYLMFTVFIYCTLLLVAVLYSLKMNPYQNAAINTIQNVSQGKTETIVKRDSLETSRS